MMSGQGSFLYWLGQALVVGLGWYVVDQLSAKRDRDKARREAIAGSIDSMTEQVTELLLIARDYHAKVRDEAIELRIKMELQDVSIRLNSLADIFLEGSPLALCRSQILALRRAVTGQHFEDEHTSPLPSNQHQYQEIAGAALELKRGLLKIKNRQFTN